MRSGSGDKLAMYRPELVAKGRARFTGERAVSSHRVHQTATRQAAEYYWALPPTGGLVTRLKGYDHQELVPLNGTRDRIVIPEGTQPLYLLEIRRRQPSHKVARSSVAGTVNAHFQLVAITAIRRDGNAERRGREEDVTKSICPGRSRHPAGRDQSNSIVGRRIRVGGRTGGVTLRCTGSRPIDCAGDRSQHCGQKENCRHDSDRCLMKYSPDHPGHLNVCPWGHRPNAGHWKCPAHPSPCRSNPRIPPFEKPRIHSRSHSRQ